MVSKRGVQLPDLLISLQLKSLVLKFEIQRNCIILQFNYSCLCKVSTLSSSWVCSENHVCFKFCSLFHRMGLSALLIFFTAAHIQLLTSWIRNHASTLEEKAWFLMPELAAPGLWCCVPCRAAVWACISATPANARSLPEPVSPATSTDAGFPEAVSKTYLFPCVFFKCPNIVRAHKGTKRL